MKDKSLKDHLNEIRPLANEARLKKYGPDYMRELANKRWKKEKAKKLKSKKIKLK